MENNEGVSFIITIEKSNANLRAQLNAINEVCGQLGCNYEVMVFVKNQDSELEKINETVQNVHQIKHEAINFYPSALRTGLKRAKYEKILLCCSDDIATVHSIKQMIHGLEYYDLISGIRPVLKRGVRAAIYSWTWHKLVRFLFNVRLKDINCPYKALLRNKAKQVGYFESDGSLTHTELVARMKAMGMKVAEFPLESFHLESEKQETYNPFVLIWTFYRLIKLKLQIAKTKKRLFDESTFHDAWASAMDVENLLVRESFEAVTAVENRYSINAMGNIEGKRILDLGCGAGETSVYFALKGAEVTAADISPEMIRVVNRLAAKWNVKLDAKVMVAEDMDFQSNHYDFVFGNGILHHLDRKKAYNEIVRVLKPGGKAIFVEPLCYNPVISIYRVLARTVRTKNEKPFRFREFRYLRELFAHVQHQEFWLTTQLIFIYFFLIKRISPRKERYWKKVIAEADSIAPMYTKLLKIDDFLFSRAPFLKRLCWNTVIVLEKAV
ncbi:MAG: methyltransferase domain-containing protein [Planctomycetota bacterium]|jgi:2-polyprenyl-3-methyl-5-hydroxy-6-metoxy-1,4-benzoquinol methylase